MTLHFSLQHLPSSPLFPLLPGIFVSISKERGRRSVDLRSPPAPELVHTKYVQPGGTTTVSVGRHVAVGADGVRERETQVCLATATVEQRREGGPKAYIYFHPLILCSHRAKFLSILWLSGFLSSLAKKQVSHSGLGKKRGRRRKWLGQIRGGGGGVLGGEGPRREGGRNFYVMGERKTAGVVD